jgi:molecular chaperone GrpE
MPAETNPAGPSNESNGETNGDTRHRRADGAAQNSEETPEVDISLSTTEMQIASLKEQLEAALDDAKKSRSDLQYKEAESQTERRRFTEQRDAAAKYRDEDLLFALLPAIESLELALNTDVSDQWGEGVKLAIREINRRLEMRGVSLVDAAAGQPFDPNEHEALAYQESTEHPPDYITQLLRPGYRLHDRLLRAAQVMVAREPQTARSEESTSKAPSGEEEHNG